MTNQIEILNNILKGWNYTPDPQLTKGMSTHQFKINEDGKITSIILKSKGLKGNIPKNFNDFDELNELDLSYNEFTSIYCDLPPTISFQPDNPYSTNMYNLDLSNNKLKGDINFISWWANNGIKPLSINLSHNYFTSISVPGASPYSKKLNIYLNNNNIQSEMPSNFWINNTTGSFTFAYEINYLDLQYNYFTEPKGVVNWSSELIEYYKGNNGKWNLNNNCFILKGAGMIELNKGCSPSLNLGDLLEESPTETKKTPKYRMCYNSRTGCFQIVH
jgi:hypothetical protein